MKDARIKAETESKARSKVVMEYKATKTTLDEQVKNLKNTISEVNYSLKYNANYSETPINQFLAYEGTQLSQGEFKKV